MDGPDGNLRDLSRQPGPRARPGQPTAGRHNRRRAEQEPRFRFYALYDRVYRLDVLRAAWSLVLKNDGAPGVDGVSCRDVLDAPEGVDGFLQTL